MRSLVNLPRDSALAKFMICLAFGLWVGGKAHAHAAEQGFVLLLPTEIYIPAAVAVFVATLVLVAVLPSSATRRLMTPVVLTSALPAERLATVTSIAATLVVLVLIWIGLTGPHDPLSNLLSLTIWTSWWIGFVVLHKLVGGLWRWINPWSGLLRLINGDRATLSLPAWLGCWPAILGFALFTSFSIADPVPADPTRLAALTGGYWLVTLLGGILFGRDWLERCDAFTVFFDLLSRISPLRLDQGLRLGFPGWGAMLGPTATLSLAVFCLAVLGIGSFDGLNETFWWMAQIGVNPLDFQGRSTIILETIAGFVGTIALLIAVFCACLWGGRILAGAGSKPTLGRMVGHLAPATLPIGLGFHAAHFFTSFAIDGQYVLAALTDPLATGADLLGLGDLRVRVGFLRDQEVVRWIWFGQAAVIVASHMIAVVMSHAAFRRLFESGPRARRAEIPLSLFMVGYTIFGLWLLAAARGA